jgi:hypothetical protein
VRRPVLLLCFCWLLTACGQSNDSKPEIEWEGVVMFDSSDDISLEYAIRVLSSSSIPTEIVGGIVTVVKVHPQHSAEAIRLLRREEGLLPYVYLPAADDSGKGAQASDRAWQQVHELGEGLSAYLQRQETDPVLRRILQATVEHSPSGRIEEMIVSVVRWSERPFVTNDLRPTTAIEASVEMVGRNRREALRVSLLTPDE